ncbi:MAG: hypothetical protein COA88_14940 [Kordia sp.]|nr:MAG: hypothetical protein COA88_14940 [Kordia sp.]
MKTVTQQIIKLLSAILLITPLFSTAQVGIGTTTPNGALDITSTNQGLVPPRIALTRTDLQAPVINPTGAATIPAGTFVWNTGTSLAAIPVADRVAPGMYYWNGTRWISLAGSPGGLDWSIIGNGGIDGGVAGVTGTPATTGIHFLGTYDNTNIDIRTNGLHAARVSSLGEFFIGALETVLPGDLMNSVSEGNATFPWAVNGYTDQNGGGVYGSVTGGTTAFAAVQGEYDGTSNSSTGVRGTNFRAIDADGTSFVSSIDGVQGNLPDTTPGTYDHDNQFGVSGSTATNRGEVVGGVFGVNNENGSYGMLGYEDSVGTAYGLLATSRTTDTFRSASPLIDTSIGIGTQGGFLGTHSKGNQYGIITKGNLAGIYSDGAAISNRGFVVIDKNINGQKTASYATTSTSIDITTKGTSKLVNGKAYVAFDSSYSNVISNNKPIIVTVSPMGESNGVYISKVDENGFEIRENNNGNSNADLYWIAVAEKATTLNNTIPRDLLEKDFDENLNSFLTVDESKNSNSKAMWWNGTNLEFGKKAPESQTQKTIKPTTKPEDIQRLNPSVKRVKKVNPRASKVN